jgi:hypothetical protein
MMTESMEIPPELSRQAHPTVRLSRSIDEATAASILSQVLPVLEVPRSIVVELFSSGGDAKVMAGFPRDRRWLTRDTTLLIDGRRIMRNVHLEGPLELPTGAGRDHR